MNSLFLTPGDLWWDLLPGPSRFRKLLFSKTEEGKHVILNDAGKISWMATFKKKCREWNAQCQNRVWHDFDVSFAGELSPGQILLETFAHDARIRTGYRVRSGKSVEQSLFDNEVLKNHLVWVRNIPEKVISQWIKCAQQYSTGGKSGNGILIIECPVRLELMESKNYAKLDYSETVQEYDNYAFCSQLLSGSEYKISAEEIRYLAAVFSRICQDEIERAVDWLKKRPTELLSLSLKKFTEQFPEIDENDLKSRLWQAQLQEFFPVIEKGRLYIVDKYAALLEELWEADCSIRYNAQKELRSGIWELEIGELFYYLPKNGLKIEQADWHMIQCLRSCRNELAHHELCSVEDASKILYYQKNLLK